MKLSFLSVAIVLGFDLLALSIVCQRAEHQKAEIRNDFQRFVAIRQSIATSGLHLQWPSYTVMQQYRIISGVAFNQQLEIYVLHRADRVWDSETFAEDATYNRRIDGAIAEAVILKFSQNLNLSQPIKTMGKNRFYLPHSIFADNEDNVWVADVAMHQVVKLNGRTGNVMLTLGEAFVPGNDEKHFCQPTDVTITNNGDIFVADGYCNSRIMKFDKDGRFLFEWGTASNNNNKDDNSPLEPPDPYDLLVPHAIALMEDFDELCVADREHYRIVCYSVGLRNDSQLGAFTRVINAENFGRIFAISYAKQTRELAILGGISDYVDRADVAVYNMETSQLTTVLQYPAKTGFGFGHSIAFCRLGKRLLVGSLEVVCPFDGYYCENPALPADLRSRNLWLYTL